MSDSDSWEILSDSSVEDTNPDTSTAHVASAGAGAGAGPAVSHDAIHNPSGGSISASAIDSAEPPTSPRSMLNPLVRMVQVPNKPADLFRFRLALADALREWRKGPINHRRAVDPFVAAKEEFIRLKLLMHTRGWKVVNKHGKRGWERLPRTSNIVVDTN